MNEDQKTQSQENETPKWLLKLQQESWQAEILISGGAFIGLIEVLRHIDLLIYALTYSTKLAGFLPGIFVGGFGLITLFLVEGFLLHLILRGYWIGLIGINFVFPKGINAENLKLQGKFGNLIKEASNTPYLLRLDKLCSLVFAFTFFVIFSCAGFVIFLGVISFSVAAVLFLMQSGNVPDYLRGSLFIFFNIIILLLVIVGVIVLIDFFMFGRLKRVKWFSRVYFPIHYVMSRITLSFLYRRLYYTIVSNIKPRYILIGLIIQIFASALVDIGLSKLSNDISPAKSSGESKFLNLKENVVTGKSLQFSITHIPRLEDEMLEEWKSKKKDTVTESFEEISSKERFQLIGSAYDIYVDTVQIKNLEWMIEQEEVLGFEISKLISLIDLSDFLRGSHELTVRIRANSKEYVVDPSNPELNYYAKAYFFIDK